MTLATNLREYSLATGPDVIGTALLELAVRAARAGGAELLRGVGKAKVLGSKASNTDPVSDVDRTSEAAIVSLIAESRPDDGILGEEGTERVGRTGLRWTIDPLDGTVNYLYGNPQCTVSIACELAVGEEWQGVVGVVYDPVMGELFSTIRGRGATLNGCAISVNEPVALSQALIATGFSYRAERRRGQGALIAELLPHVRDLRSHGSAALELCWVAAGRCDAYFEDDLCRWDWAAGALIAKEAGATVTPFGTGVLAATPGLHGQLRLAIDERGRAGERWLRT